MKKILIYNNIYFIVLLLISIVGCKIPKVLTPQTHKTLPPQFGATNDSLSSATISWQRFFEDERLLALIEAALQNNLEVLAISQRIEAANAEVWAAGGNLRPTGSFAFSPALRKFGLYTMDGAGNATTDILPNKVVPTHLPDFFIGLQTSWEIDAWKKLQNRKNAAISRYLASTEGRNWVITNLVADIAITYNELLAIAQQQEILTQTLTLQETALATLQTLKAAGRANELAVKQFEAQIYHTKVQQKELEYTAQQHENKLNLLLGRSYQPIQITDNQWNKQIPKIIQVGIPADLLQHRPDIREAELQLSATNADVHAARAAFFPAITLTGGIGMQGFNPVLLFSPKSLAYNLVGGLLLPVFNRKAIEAAHLQATAAQKEAFFHYEKTVLTAYYEVINELNQLKNLEQIQQLKQAEVQSLQQAVSISDELIKTGRATYLDVLNAQQNMQLAQLEVVEMKKKQFQAVINLYKALGGGWK